MDESFVGFDLLRRAAEERMQQGGILLYAPAAVLCLQNADLSHREKLPVLVRTDGIMAVTEVAQHLRRLSSPIGTPAKKDV